MNTNNSNNFTDTSVTSNEYIQDDTQFKWLTVFSYEIMCNLLGIFCAIQFHLKQDKKCLSFSFIILIILLLIDSFADIFSYYNIKEKYQSTIYILYKNEYLVNSNYFDIKWQNNCFQNFNQMKNKFTFNIFHILNIESTNPDNHFPLCLAEPNDYFNFLDKNFLLPINQKGVIFSNELFIEETLKYLSIGEVGNKTEFSYAGFSFNIQMKSIIDINMNYNRNFNLENCSNYSKYKIEINTIFKLHDLYYFLLFANSFIDVFVLYFISVKNFILKDKDEIDIDNHINLIFITYFPKVTSCFLMGNSIIEINNDCVILQNNFYLYQIIFVIYISISIYCFTIYTLYNIYLSFVVCFKINIIYDEDPCLKVLTFLVNIPSLFLNYIFIKTYLKNRGFLIKFIFSFFFPLFLIGLITTIFLWIIWIMGSISNKITAILQILSFTWTIVDHLMLIYKKSFKDLILCNCCKTVNKNLIQTNNETINNIKKEKNYQINTDIEKSVSEGDKEKKTINSKEDSFRIYLNEIELKIK